MFGWFKRKEPTIPATDLIFMNIAGKNNYLFSLAAQPSPPVFVCWFEETADSLNNFFEEKLLSSASIVLPREVMNLRSDQLVFCEHYPSFKAEQQRFVQWGLPKVTIVSSLEDALMKRFGGEHVALLMQRLGMKEDEPVQHAMLNQSIKRAQQKIDRKLNGIEPHAHSQKEWIEKIEMK